jgi:D-3-phosphoglycerate dehydrogenase / 2-oxoglutarate reductase
VKALITTVPFGDKNRLPLELLENAGIEYLINPLGKKLNEQELADMIVNFDVVIAGTEPITDYVMQQAAKLKMISRVGIGLDSVDLISAKRRGVVVSYTPDAPAPAVAELTVGLMLSLLRSIHVSNLHMHTGHWHRYFGHRLSESVVGIIGAGRIGKRVIQHLSGFQCKRIMVNDLHPDIELDGSVSVEWYDKEAIYREADIISLHLPLTAKTKNLIRKDQLEMMKPDALLINTSRGGIINEDDLYQVMRTGWLSGAAIDVFVEEPYNGKLLEIDRCLLTAHMGSMSVDCRTQMEIEATEEAIRFLTGAQLESVVPREEYDVQLQGL